MGSGSYTRDTFISYSKSKNIDYDYTTRKMSSHVSHQDIFKSRSIDEALNPYNVVRECCDSAEHPLTKPVILAVDITGSMGEAGTEVAKSLGVIMTDLYEKVTDIQFMTMGIGDFAYDRGPLQVSQFESDIRINEQLDKIWFEFGGGGNQYESYSAAWKFGLDHTKLDCYDKRGVKATLITTGDETLNPVISKDRWEEVTGEKLQADIETKELYKLASKKFNIYHIHIDHHHWGNSAYMEEYNRNCVRSFASVLGPQHVFTCTVEDIDKTITNIILDSIKENEANTVVATGAVDMDQYANATVSDRIIETIPQKIVNASGITTNENGEITW